MREKLRDSGRLQHIVAAIDKVFKFTDGLTIDEFRADEVRYYAVVKNIEIIGEAAYMLTPEFRDAHPQTPWKAIVAMRHFLVHGYYEVDPDEVWYVVQNDLAPLRKQIEGFLKDLLINTY